jgi:RNA polymerase sigma factor (sigma-70 family)
MTDFRTELAALHDESFSWAASCCGGDSVFAADILQTVYLKVLDGRAKFGGQSALKTWLFAVIRNTVADECRRRSREDAGLAIFAAETDIETADAPDELLSQEQLHSNLREALTTLPARQREVLRLAFYHGLSLTEVSDVTCISIGSVRQHYERGKQRLRDILNPMKATL